MYALVTAVDRLLKPSERSTGLPYREYVSVRFDGIESSEFERGWSAAREKPEPFVLLRVVTTERRLSEILVGEDPLRPGDWVELFLVDRDRPKPIVLMREENDGFQRQLPTRLQKITKLDEEPRPPKSLGAAAAPAAVSSALGRAAKAAALKRTLDPGRIASAGSANSRWVHRILQGLPPVERVVVHDVGQANFISLRTATDETAAYFDVGWPIWVNSKTVPKNAPSLDATAPVFLSHWDTDHFAMAYRDPSLLARCWIAPRQMLGPNAYKLAEGVHCLHLIDGKSTRRGRSGHVRLHRCWSKDPVDANGAGVAMEICVSGKNVLLTGDADYRFVSRRLRREVDHIVVPHHGGRVLGEVPSPRLLGGKAVFSFGKENRYGHPHDNTVGEHHARGWILQDTAGLFSSSRGDVVVR